MPLRGKAFLALWNRFDPALESEYETWHTFEHVPERVGVPGFISGRRYGCDDAEGKHYFTLYELEDLSALDSSAYLDLINRPTAWSTKMRRSFRGFFRLPCQLVRTEGQGVSGAVGTLSFAVPLALADDGGWLAALLRELRGKGAVTAFHLGLTLKDEGYSVFGQPPIEEPETATFTVVLEGTSRKALLNVIEGLAATIEGTVGPVRFIVRGSFDLLFAIDRSDVQLEGERVAPRADLQLLLERIANGRT